MRIFFFDNLRLNAGMANIDDIRRANMRALAKEHGSIAALGKIIGKGDAQISQWINGSPDSKTGKPRGMRSETCREIEKKTGKPENWLDIEQLEEETPAASAGKNKGISINQYDTGGAMGGGLVLRDQPGIIESWRVTAEWLSKNVKGYTNAGNLAVVTGFGDSMKGMFNPGDPLLVDTGVKSIDFDGVYFFRVGDEGFIKRLQRIPGEGILAISENKAYRDWTIKRDMDFEVFGRVLKVWESTDF